MCQLCTALPPWLQPHPFFCRPHIHPPNFGVTGPGQEMGCYTGLGFARALPARGGPTQPPCSLEEPHSTALNTNLWEFSFLMQRREGHRNPSHLYAKCQDHGEKTRIQQLVHFMDEHLQSTLCRTDHGPLCPSPSLCSSCWHTSTTK